MKILIVDDEAPARNRLARKISLFKDFEIVGEASNGVDALEKIEQLRPEVVFLDIEMPELDGLGVARSLGLHGPKIIFVTAYDEHALSAFEASATDYLVKPISDARLFQTIERLRHGRGSKPSMENLPPSRTAIKSGNKFIVIDPLKISAIVARDHYAAVLVEGREFLVEESLDAVASRFKGVNFLRTHRSGMINVNALSELLHEGDRKYIAVLNDKTRVPVSRERLDDVKRELGL